MPSMSYCVIENTVDDFEECVDKVRNALENGEKLSREEYRRLGQLVEHAKALVELDKKNDFDVLDPRQP